MGTDAGPGGNRGAHRALGALAAVALPAAFAAVAVLSLTSDEAAKEPPVPEAAASGRAALVRLLAPQMVVATPVAVNRASEPTTVSYAPIPNNPDGTTTPRPPRPARLVIDALGIDASLQPVRGTPLGIEVPPLDSAGWYSEGPRPGEPGRTVLIGHRDSAEAAAVFARLPEIEPGTPIEVTDDAGEIHRLPGDKGGERAQGHLSCRGGPRLDAGLGASPHHLRRRFRRGPLPKQRHRLRRPPPA